MIDPSGLWLTGFALALFRVGGLMLVAPFWSSRSVPLMVRSALTVLLVTLLIPVLQGSPRPDHVGVLSFVSEWIIGVGIGLGAAILIAGVELAGDVLAIQTGLSGANVLDPLSGQGTGAVSQLLTLVVTLLLLVTGGHLVMLEALARSFEVAPLGVPVDVRSGALHLVRLGALVFYGGLQFAAPIVAAVSLGYLALGVLARTSPQLNMLAVAFPLQIGIGLLVLALVLPFATVFFASWPEHVSGLADRFLDEAVAR